jgi:hypothetical protein
VEPGEVIDVTSEELANIADVVVPVNDVVAEAPAEEVEEKPVDQMSLDELKAKAEELGLSKSGSKADLIERITLHQQDTPAEEVEG